MSSRSRIEEILLNTAGLTEGGILSAILQVYGDALYKATFRIVHSPDLAHAAVAETIETVWRRQQEIAAMKHPAAWIMQCARHKALNMLRTEKRKTTTRITTFVLEMEVQDDYFQLEEKKLLHSIIGKMPVQQRRVILLKHFQGKSRKEIARICQLSEHTVRNHLSKAYKNLRKTLSEIYPEYFKQ